MNTYSNHTQYAYLKHYYSAEQIERFCGGSDTRLSELWEDTQPQSIAIEHLCDVNNGALYLADSPDGYVPVEQWRNKGRKSCYTISTVSGFEVTASHDHLFQKHDGSWVYARDLHLGDALLTENGLDLVSSKTEAGDEIVYDLAIGHDNHRYFTNGISSHNSGKSLWLQNIALNWVFAGMTVIYFTLELSEDLTASRLDAMVTNRSTTDVFKDIKDAALTIRTMGKKAANGVTPGNLIIKKLPEGGTNANDLRAFIKEYEIKTGKRPDAIVVDYLDLMHPNDRGIDASNAFVRDKHTSEEMRALAGEMQLLCATASQLNRGAVEAQGQFDHSHIAGGLSKINTADNVFAIYAPPSMMEKGEYQLYFLKTRSSNAVGSMLKMRYDPVSMRIYDIEDVNDATKPMDAASMRASLQTKPVPVVPNGGTASPATPPAMTPGRSQVMSLLGKIHGAGKGNER